MCPVRWELCQISAFLAQNPLGGPPSRAALPRRGCQAGVGHRVGLTSPSRGTWKREFGNFHSSGARFFHAGLRAQGWPQPPAGGDTALVSPRSPRGARRGPASTPVPGADIPSPPAAPAQENPHSTALNGAAARPGATESSREHGLILPSLPVLALRHPQSPARPRGHPGGSLGSPPLPAESTPPKLGPRSWRGAAPRGAGAAGPAPPRPALGAVPSLFPRASPSSRR